MSDSFDIGVSLAAVDFQNEVQTWGNLPQTLGTYLRTAAFPTSAPPSLRSAPDYGGLKLFVYQKRYLCIAYFFNDNKTDEYQRAIASANVLVMDRTLQEGGFRNLPAITDFLMTVSAHTETYAETLSLLRSIYTEATITDSVEQFAGFFSRQQVDYDMLATALGLLIAYGRLIICCPNPAAGQAFFTALFALTPFEVLEATTWCTYANSIQGFHEGVVLYGCQLPPPSPESWFEKVKGRFSSEKEEVDIRIDISTGAFSPHNLKIPKYRVTQASVHELLHNGLNLPGTFEDRFHLFQNLLGRCYNGTLYDARGILPDNLASADIEARLQAFVKEVTHV